MQEHDIRLLFEAGQIESARVIVDSVANGWNVSLIFRGERPAVILNSKRGGRRVFKTSDAALSWCGEIGLKSIKVQLDGAVAGRGVRRAGAKDKILLVEDNEDDISLTVRAFQQNRIDNEIVIKRDGQEALNYLFSDTDDAHPGSVELPALVLLDINLPKLNGFEVLQQIRGSESTRLLPVVILTTSDEPEDICRGYDLGTNSYLKKPNDLRMLRTMVSEIGDYWMGLNISPSR